MKTFQKRLYSALPRAVPASSGSGSSSPISRVRSNSASSPRSLYTAGGTSSPLSFFESGGPPTVSRPHVVARLESRVEVEVHTNAHTHGTSQQTSHNSATNGGTSGGAPPPWSLALTTPNSNPSSSPHGGSAHQSVSFFPYAPFATVPVFSPAISPSLDARPHPKRQRTRYHLDVGAYGIAKRRSRGRTNDSRPHLQMHPSHAEDLHLATAVGEDAYFVRENAMGVADGVGGWARLNDSSLSRSTGSENTPSALFARRLMHYCSAELDVSPTRTTYATPAPSHGHSSYDQASPWNRPPSQPHSAFSAPLSRTRRSTNSAPMNQVDELFEELEESLEELEEGLDVLRILEKAYEKTLKAHVEPARPTSPSTLEVPMATSIPAGPCSRSQSSDPVDRLATRLSPALSLSSSGDSLPSSETFRPLLAGSSTALVAILDHAPILDVPASTAAPGEFTQPTAPSACSESGAVLRIANLGDSMGMLVRGEGIVWRSEEMWSSFNTPVQLGPRSNTRPMDACVIALPVQADDILILATDGLSDNLWDEEVLDEVVRFRRSFLRKPSAELAESSETTLGAESLLGRRTLAGMLSEALCSRARRVSERGHGAARAATNECGPDDETPFARRARENGRPFRGGKTDDISVVVAVISPTD